MNDWLYDLERSAGTRDLHAGLSPLPAGFEVPPLYVLKGAELRAWMNQNELRFTWIYAIQEGVPGEQGPIKIGRADDPQQRLMDMQVGNSRTLTGVAAWRSVPEDEKWLHRVLAPLRIRGEWFAAYPFLVEFLLTWGCTYCWKGEEHLYEPLEEVA